MNQYDYEYWLEQNENNLGVHPNQVEKVIDGTNVFISDRLSPDIKSITNAISNDQRVLMGFNTENNRAHAVMVRKVKVWPSGKHRIWYFETSPVRIAPYSSNILPSGAGFWTFTPF